MDEREILRKVEKRSKPENLGMVILHKGIVRGTSREGEKVKGMELFFNKEKLKRLIKEAESREGIEAVEVWINQGKLKVGDTIMLVAVGGRFRKDVLPVLEWLVGKIKEEVVVEREV